MAAFFSLGARGGSSTSPTALTPEHEHHLHHNNNGIPTGQISPDSSWPFLYRNDQDPAAFKGTTFELWLQQDQHHHYPLPKQQQQQQQQQHIRLCSSTPTHDPYASASYLCVGPTTIRTSLTAAAELASSSADDRSISGTGGIMSCQDCGNKAKKDCAYMRCRGCCKSRGFQCATHVRSTWVPAAKRRERQQQQQQQLAVLQQQQQLRGSGIGEPSKRQRIYNDNSSNNINKNIPAASYNINSASSGQLVRFNGIGVEVGGFPSEVSSQAVFRCVMVTSSSLNDQDGSGGDHKYAYQTAVTIGGHVFKGILYDQGTEGSYTSASGPAGDESSSGGTAGVSPPSLNLIHGPAATAFSATGTAAAVGSSSSSPMELFLDSTAAVASPLYQTTTLRPYLVSGTQFFASQRP